ncbi:MAG: hypothetical protein IJM34_07870 [Lachnospiraceae bacterium]|nr:hypothetical protein [Lachnospiraceae bacterium]
MMDGMDLIVIVFALVITLLIEVPYVALVMKYRPVKNILGINVFTNVLINTILYVFNESDHTFIIWLVFELIFIPVAEWWFYINTDMNGLSKKRIIINTYIANSLSAGIGVVLTELLYEMIYYM